ncbi:hypothetical protein HX870_16950 [Pseudomonas gingeri]|uniref:hypothetical protein n=1 Tax=Pseudomonas gingeri TaxID=117681 RepID=UPI0015A05EF1|nr:hypothetical protein [Pseudomonas gingeri]NWD69291.1 hypothetical protein [Pseudomonas gingeri]
MSTKIKDIIQIATHNIIDLFSVQNISGVLFEEVARDLQKSYLITISFERPTPNKTGPVLGAGIAALMATPRVYKVVCLDKESDEILWIKDRMLQAGQ